MKNDRVAQRVLIIGLDGATFNIIQPLLNKNNLPFFKKLTQQGSYGVVESNLPLNSAANWASLFTGKNPGKHNIYDYLTYDNQSYQPKLITNQSLKSNLIWNIANQYDLRTILLNAPVASYPEPLNGIMVSGMITPLDQRYAYPDTIAEELQEENYLVDSAFARNLDSEIYFDQIMKTLMKQERTFEKLINNHPWDLAILTLNALSKAQHDFWNEKDKIDALYIQIDSFLNNIYKSLDQNTYVLVVSHHGFKPVSKKFFVNEWLWDIGLLDKKITIQQSRLTDVYDIIFNHKDHNPSLITNIFARTGITKNNIRSILPVSLAEILKRIVSWSIKKYFPMEYLEIGWEKTKAYFVSTNTQGININLKGREPQGIVEPGKEYEQLRGRIISELYRLRDPYTLEPVVDQIFRKEDIFTGEYVDSAPDIIFVPHQYDYYLDSGKRTCRLFIGPALDNFPVHSFHDPKGLFFLSGPGVKKGEKISAISIYDIAPTVLHLLGISAEENLDGQILYRAFDYDSTYEYANRPYIIPTEENIPFVTDNLFRHKEAVGIASM